MPNSVRKKPRIKQFRIEGCVSYFFFDSSTREAVLIDPHLGLMNDYRSYLGENRLDLKTVVETSTHADHHSASHLLRADLGVEIAMSSRSDSARATRKLSDGDRVAVGGFFLEVIHTPGHAPDSICLAAAGVIFTGDTLWIGSAGPVGLPGSDARELWKSLHGPFSKLPGDTVIFPGHDHNDLLFSTLAIERKRNEQLAIPDPDAFARVKEPEKSLAWDGNFKARLEFNRAASPVEQVAEEPRTLLRNVFPMNDANRASTINVEKYHHKLEEHSKGMVYLDVREPDEFEAGHMPGARNIPMSEVPLHLHELMGAKRIYVSCLSGRRSGWTARTLAYLGMDDVVNVSGGWQAWLSAGLPIEKGSDS